jgi:hypothetical protein
LVAPDQTVAGGHVVTEARRGDHQRQDHTENVEERDEGFIIVIIYIANDFLSPLFGLLVLGLRVDFFFFIGVDFVDFPRWLDRVSLAERCHFLFFFPALVSSPV